MNKTLAFALFLIATSALPTWAQGSKVYRCGATYSQTPCAQGVALEVQDARTPEQKLQADQSTVRDGVLANTLEKDRLQAQTQAHAAAQQQARSAHLAADAKTAAPRATKEKLLTPRGTKHKKKPTSETFRALAWDAQAGKQPPAADAPAKPKTRKKKS